MDIDYGALYGVKHREKDFSGAIKRSIEQIKQDGLLHLDKFIEMIKNIKNKNIG